MVVKTLQAKVKWLKSHTPQIHTQDPKDFEGISGIRRASASLDSFDTKILRDGESEANQFETVRYKNATAVMVNQLFKKQDGRALDEVFRLLKESM